MFDIDSLKVNTFFFEQQQQQQQECHRYNRSVTNKTNAVCVCARKKICNNLWIHKRKRGF